MGQAQSCSNLWTLLAPMILDSAPIVRNIQKATNGKFPNLMPSGVKSINLKVKMDHDGYSAERKLQILKRCFEGTENIRDVAIEEGISRNIIYIWRKKYLKYGVFGLQ